MKNILTLSLFMTQFLTYAQIPAGYYDSAAGLKGTPLKNALNDIIDGHTEIEYTATSTDIWDVLKETDKDPNNSSNVILLYSGKSVDAAQEYNSGSGWSREHVWAKSRGDFGNDLGPGTDAHHIRPADISVNSARNNRWFAECSTPYLDDGTPTGSYTSSTEWVWKPRDEVKGDVARMIFYMDVRYAGENGELDLRVIDYIPTDDNTTEPIHAKLSDLLQWHLDDPVDAFEQNRNDVVYSYQNNRNPFIDHPEYVSDIWIDTTESSSTGIDDNIWNELVIKMNNGRISVEGIAPIQRTRLLSINGQVVQENSSTTIVCGNIANGIYILEVELFDGYITRKKIAWRE